MAGSDRAVPAGGQRAADVLVVGAGIMGLWMALKAARAGLSVIITDRAEPGAGASGGFLGALMPHMPERWNGKKAFQFEALVALEHEAARLKDETGIDPHYARCGRLIPIATDRARAAHEARSADAAARWGPRFGWTVLPQKPDPELLSENAAPFGVLHETLSARVHPPSLIGALVAALERHPRVTVLSGHDYVGFDRHGGKAAFANGARLTAGTLVLANGLQAFPMIAELAGKSEVAIGSGVKGQAALLSAEHAGKIDPANPLAFHDGVYVIAHGDGTVAVGSTSETSFHEPFQTDEQLEKVIDEARSLVPALSRWTVVRRWAGVRPRAVGRDPLAGPVPGCDGIFAMTGGFKIGFGIAHALADAILDLIVQDHSTMLPESFLPASHIRKGRPA